MNSSSRTPKVRSSGLKPLKGWHVMVYPPILALVGIFTWCKDRLLSSLPRRSYGRFAFQTSMLGTWIFNKSLKVLVVDDAQLHHDISHQLFESKGHAADFARNRMEAVKACRNTHYDLILMNMDLPGLEAAHEMRRESVLPLRILAVTGKLPVDREDLKLSGLDGFMIKPFAASALQEVFQESLTKKRQVS